MLDPRNHIRCLVVLTTIILAIAWPSSGLAAVCEGVDGVPGDLDGDGVVAAEDCDDGDPGVETPPGAAQDLRAASGAAHVFVWDTATDLGGTSPSVSFGLIRSADAADFSAAACIEPFGLDTSAEDPEIPPPGGVFHYLVRVHNECGGGDLGASSSGVPRVAAACDCSVACDDGDSCTTDTCSDGTCDNDVVEPSIVLGPAGASACAGGPARFSVRAEGSGALAYQWFKNGAPAGTDSPVLELNGVAAADDGAAITVEVFDGCSSAVSSPATLTVFADQASCAGGLDGQEAPSAAGEPAGSTRSNLGPIRWMAPEALRARRGGGQQGGAVYLHSGEYHLTEIDLILPGRGLDVVWSRTYRSREWRQSSMGNGWTHSYDRRVEVDPADPDRRLVHTGDSRIDAYEPNALGCWEAHGFFRELCQQPGGEYVLTLADRAQWTFLPLDGSAAEGRLSAIADRNRNTISLAYDASGRLTTVTDTLGRTVTVAHDARDRVASVTGPTGRQVLYDYHDGSTAEGNLDDLLACTTPAVTGTPTGNDFPAGKTTAYTYSTGFADGRLNHNLLTITDPSGQTFLRNVYTGAQDPFDPRFDRLDRQVVGDRVVAYTYAGETPAAANNFAVSRTIVNDRAGHVAEFFYDASARLVVERDLTGRAPDPDRPTGTASNRPVNPLRPADPAAFETRFEYNADGLLTRCVLPQGNEVQWSYDSSNSRVRLRGNLLQRVRLPGPLGGDQPQIVEAWQYATDFGTRHGPDADTVAATVIVPYSGQLASDGELLSRTGAGLGRGGQGSGRVERASGEKASYGGMMGIGHPRFATGHGAGVEGVSGEKASYGGMMGIGHPRFATGHDDGNGDHWSMGYDAQGNLQVLSAPAVTVGIPGGMPQIVRRTWSYNPFGQVTQHVGPAGRIDQFTYHTSGPGTGFLASAVRDQPNQALTTTYNYDAVGNLVSVTDPRGATVDYEVNERHQIVRAVDRAPFRYETDFHYDANDRLVRVDVQNLDQQGAVQPNSHLTSRYDYDGLDRLTAASSETGPGACVREELEWDASGNHTLLRRGESSSGSQPANTVRLLYDERDLPFRRVRAEGTAVSATDQYDYDANGNLAVHRQGLEDPAGAHVTGLSYDGYDRLTARTDATGNETAYGYDASSNRTSLRHEGEEIEGVSGSNVLLYEADFVYDEIDRRVQTDEQHFDIATGAPVGDGVATTAIEWTPDSLPAVVRDDNGHETTYAYDGLRRLRLVTDSAGHTTEIEYDSNSNPTRLVETDLSDLGGPPQTFVTEYDYDELDRRVRTTDNLGHETSQAYDSRDNVVRSLDARGNLTRYFYDGIDRLLSVETDLTDTGDGTGTVVDTIATGTVWDDSSRPVSRTDDNGHATLYAYDALDRPVAVTRPDGTVESLGPYDPHDNLLETTDPNGTAVTYQYDARDRLVATSVAPGSGVGGTTFESYLYDGLDRLVSAEDDDSLATFAYDSLSNPVRETLQVASGPARDVVRLYDGTGNPLGALYPSGRSVQLQYDALDRLDVVVSDGSLVAAYDYVGPVRVARLVRGSAVATDYEYDGARRATRVHHHDGTGATLFDRVFAWDAASNRTEHSEPGGTTTTFAYDSLHRLQRGTRSAAGTTTQVADYTYDGAGNRLSVNGGPEAGTYELDATLPQPADRQVNQYTSTPRGGRLHDDNGNLSALDGASATERSLVWDHRDQVIEAHSPATSTSFRYDALGRRIEKATSGGATRRYYYDLWRVVEEQDAADRATLTYVWGNGLDEALQMREEIDLDGTGLATLDYHPDEMLVVLGLTDASTGVAIERYDYDDFGTPSFFDGSGAPQPGSAAGNPYLFTGRRWDQETGLYHYRTRYLDPAAGRFVSRDRLGTWGDGGNLGNAFTYVGNNPWSYSDPFGLMNKAELIDAIASAPRRTGRNPQTGKEIKIAAKSVNGGNNDNWDFGGRSTLRGVMVRTGQGEVELGGLLRASGGGSADDGEIHDFIWRQTGGPFKFSTRAGSVVPQIPGTYVFNLAVGSASETMALQQAIQMESRRYSMQAPGGSPGNSLGSHDTAMPVMQNMK